MKENRSALILRIVLGGTMGALLAPALVWIMSALLLPAESQAVGSLSLTAAAGIVTPEMAASFGSVEVAVLVQSALGALFGAVVAMATMPFADDGRELILRSLIHFAATAGSFSLMMWVCRWVDGPRYILLWVGVLALLYGLIWLGRWIGWYMEVIQLRELLGLDPGPTPLKWRETLPYMLFALLICDLLPLTLRGMELLLGIRDVQVFTWLLYPWLLLPVIGYASGLSLGKRQGVCPLYPVACFVCYLPMVYILFNGGALFHCFLVAVPALAGNVTGFLYRRAVPKKRGKTGRDRKGNS